MAVVPSYSRSYSKSGGLQQQKCIHSSFWRLQLECWQGHAPSEDFKRIRSLPLPAASSFHPLPPRSRLLFSVSRVKLSFCLLLIRIHVIALRAHLDNLCFSPHLKILNHTCKDPFLICFPHKVYFQVSGIRACISLGIGRTFVSLPQVSS